MREDEICIKRVGGKQHPHLWEPYRDYVPSLSRNILGICLRVGVGYELCHKKSIFSIKTSNEEIPKTQNPKLPHRNCQISLTKNIRTYPNAHPTHDISLKHPHNLPSEGDNDLTTSITTPITNHTVRSEFSWKNTSIELSNIKFRAPTPMPRLRFQSC